jgi:hypothetical protein
MRVTPEMINSERGMQRLLINVRGFRQLVSFFAVRKLADENLLLGTYLGIIVVLFLVTVE